MKKALTLPRRCKQAGFLKIQRLSNSYAPR